MMLSKRSFYTMQKGGINDAAFFFDQVALTTREPWEDGSSGSRRDFTALPQFEWSHAIIYKFQGGKLLVCRDKQTINQKAARTDVLRTVAGRLAPAKMSRVREDAPFSPI